MFTDSKPRVPIWAILAITIWSLACLYLVAITNPELMSQQSLQQHISEKQQDRKLQAIIVSDNLSGDSTALNKDFSAPFLQNREEIKAPIRFRLAGFETISTPDFDLDAQDNWYPDLESNRYLFLSKDSKTLSSVSPEGKHWSMTRPEGGWQQPWIGAKSVVLASDNGDIYVVDRESGALAWLLHSQVRTSQVTVAGNNIVALQRSEDGSEYRFSLIDIANGSLGKTSEWSKGEIKSPIKRISDNSIAFINDENSVSLFDLQSMQNKWTHQNPGEITSPLSKIDDLILFGDTDSRAVALKIKDGDVFWETPISSPVRTEFVRIPTYKFVSVMTDSGHLHTIRLNTGEGKWKFNTKSNSKHKQISAWRSTSGTIMRLKLKWVHKGWTIVAPCKSSSLCFFTPDKGQPIGVINTQGTILGTPFIKDSQTMLLKISSPTKTPEGAEEGLQAATWQWARFEALKPLKGGSQKTSSDQAEKKDSESSSKKDGKKKKKKSGWSWF